MNLPELVSENSGWMFILGLYAIQVLNIWRIKQLEKQVERIIQVLFKPVNEKGK